MPAVKPSLTRSVLGEPCTCSKFSLRGLVHIGLKGSALEEFLVIKKLKKKKKKKKKKKRKKKKSDFY
jgi:hypothetical protein